MTLCEKLRQLRKARDLTQEQLADIFHVSPQAISRWETGAAYPDIVQLPHIAIFFKVTVDELLGTEAILGEANAAERIRDIRLFLNAGRLTEAIDMARRATREYPLNHDLQYLLLQALCTACADDTPEIKREIIAMGRRIESAPEPCHALKFLLIRQFAKWGMTDDARRIVDSLPKEAYFTQDLTLSYALEGDAWRQNQELRIKRFTIMLCDMLKAYAHRAASDVHQKIAYLKAAMQIEQATQSISVGDEDAHLVLAFENIALAELCVEAGDGENALLHTENAADEAMHHLACMGKTNADGTNYFPWETPRNLCWVLWEDFLSRPQFDAVRCEKRFTACFHRLQTNSRELTRPQTCPPHNPRLTGPS